MANRFMRLFVMAAFLLGSATAARAATVSQFVSGTVGGQYTTDTYGLFGPAGANLTGQPITVFMQYNASLPRFPVRYICALGCSGYSTAQQRKPDLPGAALIVVTLNRLRYVFVPAKAATLQFTNFYQCYFALGVDAPSYKEGAQVSLYYTSAVGFGATLSPVNNPINFNPPPNSNPPPNNVAISVSGEIERISFTILKASR